MSFRVGQKVVCVGCPAIGRSPGFWNAWVNAHGVIRPKRMAIYTVRDTRLATDGTQRIRVVEIVNPIVPFSDAPSQEPWFQSRAFRAAVERKTDISVFTEMLTKHPENVS